MGGRGWGGRKRKEKRKPPPPINADTHRVGADKDAEAGEGRVALVKLEPVLHVLVRLERRLGKVGLG